MLTISEHPINEQLITYIEQNRHLLTPDHSTYSKHRLRAWIGAEAPLLENLPFKDAPFNYESLLWRWLANFCKTRLDFIPEVALLHVGGADCSDPTDKPLDGKGGECGIKRHRDASYADYRAVGINLSGEATFGYHPQNPTQDRWVRETDISVELQHVKMVQGTCVVFNCKNPHFAEVGANRFAINCWRISAKARSKYEAYLASRQK